MYKEIHVHKEHQDYQRIVWRKDPSDLIQNYRLLRVVFGMKSSPWLATRCLMQIAEDIQGTDPIIADLIRFCFYMDDFLGGADSPEEAVEIQERISRILKSYGFTLCK